MLGEKEIGIFQSISESLKTIAKAAEIYIEKSENEKKVGEMGMELVRALAQGDEEKLEQVVNGNPLIANLLKLQEL